MQRSIKRKICNNFTKIWAKRLDEFFAKAELKKQLQATEAFDLKTHLNYQNKLKQYMK